MPTEHSPHHETDQAWSSASNWLPIDDPEYALDPDREWYNETLEAGVMDTAVPVENPSSNPQKKKRIQSNLLVGLSQSDLIIYFLIFFLQKRPHVAWKNTHRQTYLEEILQWARRGDFHGAQECPDCLARGSSEAGLPEYCCRECFIPDLVCRTCCVKHHRAHTLHH